MKINRRIVPNISFMGEIYSYREQEDCWPLEQIVKKMQYRGKFLLSGEGSIGKSTTITDLRLMLLSEGRPHIYCNLKELNNDASKAVKIEKLIKTYTGNNLTLLFDSFDETSVNGEDISHSPRYIAEKLIEQCCSSGKIRLIVVGARIGCDCCHDLKKGETKKWRESRRESGDSLGTFETWAKEKSFKILRMESLSEEKIRQILNVTIQENHIEIPDSLRDLLSNTMILCMFVRMYEEGVKIDGAVAKTNEATFIFQYFYSLFAHRANGVSGKYDKENAITARFKSLKEIGKNVYDSICGRAGEPVLLPEDLNTFFYMIEGKDGQIASCSQDKYLLFCAAWYLYDQMRSLVRLKNIQNSLSRVRNLLSVYKDLVTPGRYVQKNRWKQILIYLGELCAAKDIFLDSGHKIIQLLNRFQKSCSYTYRSILFIYFGYRNFIYNGQDTDFQVGRMFRFHLPELTERHCIHGFPDKKRKLLWNVEVGADSNDYFYVGPKVQRTERLDCEAVNEILQNDLQVKKTLKKLASAGKIMDNMSIPVGIQFCICLLSVIISFITVAILYELGIFPGSVEIYEWIIAERGETMLAGSLFGLCGGAIAAGIGIATMIGLSIIFILVDFIFIMLVSRSAFIRACKLQDIFLKSEYSKYGSVSFQMHYKMEGVYIVEMWINIWLTNPMGQSLEFWF